MIPRCLLLLTAVGVLTLAMTVPVESHHAVGEVYDETETLTLEGEIVKLVYRNPHSLIHLDVAGRSGAYHTWAVELRGVDRLRESGVDQGSLQPGDHVIVCGHPGRDPGQFRLRLLTLMRSPNASPAQAPRC